MTNVVDFATSRPAPARDREPDEAFSRLDQDGFTLFLFAAEYRVDGVEHELELWAYDAGHAARQIAALQGSLKLPVQVISRDDREPPLERRLAECLRDCVDTTLATVRDTVNDRQVELRLGSFDKGLSDRAGELLEEAGL